MADHRVKAVSSAAVLHQDSTQCNHAAGVLVRARRCNGAVFYSKVAVSSLSHCQSGNNFVNESVMSVTDTLGIKAGRTYRRLCKQ